MMTSITTAEPGTTITTTIKLLNNSNKTQHNNKGNVQQHNKSNNNSNEESYNNNNNSTHKNSKCLYEMQRKTYLVQNCRVNRFYGLGGKTE